MLSITAVTNFTQISTNGHAWTHLISCHDLSTSLQQKFCCGGVSTRCCILKRRSFILHVNSEHRHSVNADLAALDVPSTSCPTSLLPTLFSKSSNHTMSFRFKIFKRIKIYVCRYLRKCGLKSSYPQKIIASEKSMDLRWGAFTIVDLMFITSSLSSYVIDASM